MTRLLVTGFGPFPRMPRNPSAEVAQAVAAAPRLRLHGIEARAFVLTTAYACLAGELDPLLAEDPDVVLLVGVAGRSAKVRVETRATSRRSTLYPDVLGDVPGNSEHPHPEVLREAKPRRTQDGGACFEARLRRAPQHEDVGGSRPRVPRGTLHASAARLTRVNTTAALRSLARHGLPARRSRDAGRYLCNAAYFRALARRGPTLFVHIPKCPTSRRMGDARPRRVGAGWRRALAAALVETAIGLARDARRVVRDPGFR